MSAITKLSNVTDINIVIEELERRIDHCRKSLVAASKQFYGTVYCITEVDTRKMYIGSTTGFEERSRVYFRKRDNPRPIEAVIKARGIHNFTFSVLAYTYDEEETIELEEFFIRRYKTRFPQFGYNVADAQRQFHSSEAKKARSKGIYAIKGNELLICDSAELFAQHVGVHRTNVTEALNKCNRIKEYYLFRADDDARMTQIETAKLKLQTLGRQDLIRIKEEFLVLAEKLEDGVETIRNEYETKCLRYTK